MKIAIEAQRIFRGDKHGMDFVILEVLRELQRLDTGPLPLVHIQHAGR